MTNVERVGTMNEKVTLSRETAAADLDKVSALCDILGLQEWGPPRNDILAAHAGWDWAKPGRTSPPVGVHSSRYHGLTARTVVLAKGRKVNAQAGKRSRLPDVEATLAHFTETATGDTEAVLNFHLPRGVEDHGTYARIKGCMTGRARMHRQARRKARRIMQAEAKRVDRVYGLGDTNFHLMRLRGFVSCFEGRAATPTLGKRTVDLVYGTQRADSVRVIRTASDHRAVVVTYKLRS